MSKKRKSITKKLRFEVFKRDSFTCQYCGRMAPDVVLEIDHINPVSNGGENDIMNLVTSCFDCNRGKGKRKLSENETIKKQQEQLKELNEKREQLEMMLQWRNELARFEDEQVNEVEEYFNDLTGRTFTEIGREEVKKWIKKYGLIEVLDCLQKSEARYFKGDDESADKTFNYIPRIAASRKRQKDNPMLVNQHYIKGILRNRGMLYNERRLYAFLNEICTDELNFEVIKDIACNCRNWTEFWREANEEWEGDW